MDLDSDSLMRGISFDSDSFLPTLEKMLGECITDKYVCRFFYVFIRNLIQILPPIQIKWP